MSSRRTSEWGTLCHARRARLLDTPVCADYAHGIGLEPYERPKLQRGSETPLEVGEVLRIEMPHYEHGWAGLNLKETVLITGGGARVLNRSRRGLVVLD